MFLTDGILITVSALLIMYFSIMLILNKAENAVLRKAYDSLQAFVRYERVARFITDDKLAKFKEITGLGLSIIKKGEVKAETNNIYEKLNEKNSPPFFINKKSGRFFIYKPDYRNAFVYSIFKDISGEDIGVFELKRPRSAIMGIRQFYIKLSVFILLFVVISILFLATLTTRYILNPLTELTKAIAGIKETKDMLRRINIESQDEIGIFAGEFNAMMDALDRTQNELLRAQQSLIQSEKMSAAAELATGAVHQINNPLSIVVGRASLLRKAMGSNLNMNKEDFDKGLKVVEEQAKRAIDITNNLLLSAKPVVFWFEKCDINKLVNEAVALVKAQLETANIEIEMNLAEGLPEAQYCDIGRMRDVFENIIINAQVAMPEGGKLRIGTYYDGKQDLICIQFEDTGIGIPPENLSKIFVPFFSTDANRTGLGLAISYNILKGHRGTIEVKSSVGRGSTFVVKLPAKGLTI